MPRESARVVQLRTYRHLPEREVGRHTFEGDRFGRLSEALVLSAEGNRLRIANRGVGHPLRIRRDTTYELEVAAPRGGTEVGKLDGKGTGRT